MRNNIIFIISLIPFLLLGQDADNWQASTIQPGDVLSINVFRVSEFSREVRIDEDGVFTYPLCGEIQTSGKTPRDIAKEMTVLLSKQITNPFVDVTISHLAPRSVFLIGEVKGSKSIELSTFGRMTAMQAFSEVGGFTESADLNNIVVLRRDKSKNNQLVRHKIDVSALTSTSHGTVQDFHLLPGDTIIVPRAPAVYISGEIKSPNAFYIDTQNPPLLSEFVIKCGGLTENADPENILIVRSNSPSGNTEPISVSLHMEELGSYSKDIRLQPGDHIFVGAADQIYVLGQVRNPGPISLGPSKKLTASQAIVMAGGFTIAAKQSDVTLIREGIFQSLDLKKIYNSVENMSKDVPLQNGDVLFVKESFW